MNSRRAGTVLILSVSRPVPSLFASEERHRVKRRTRRDALFPRSIPRDPDAQSERGSKSGPPRRAAVIGSAPAKEGCGVQQRPLRKAFSRRRPDKLIKFSSHLGARRESDRKGRAQRTHPVP
ncbi:hypothetical protein HPB50_004435 [Hyalomma asiaticum]|uniref:Uncharacterized protein n=1 Tax=Hyalomma asiaticum TaxID=266040 RepID=A0ACB7TF15_HYAAI|nr:hypothetical protein HPB50_004435 [Hyalomma asiaticum]